jgi:hypothetical protein
MNFSVRSRVDDFKCQVSLSDNKAKVADNDLSIMFARKGSNQETIGSVHCRSTLIWWFYGADQEYLTKMFDEDVLVIDHKN